MPVLLALSLSTVLGHAAVKDEDLDLARFEEEGTTQIGYSTYTLGWVPLTDENFAVYIRLLNGHKKPSISKETGKKNFIYTNFRPYSYQQNNVGIQIDKGGLRMPPTLINWRVPTSRGTFNYKVSNHPDGLEFEMVYDPSLGKNIWRSREHSSATRKIIGLALLVSIAGIVYKTRAIPKLKRYLIGPSDSERLNIVEKIADL